MSARLKIAIVAAAASFVTTASQAADYSPPPCYDAATIAAGPLRDIAITGALRKAKQSERVSYETALALADLLGLDEAAATLTTIRDEEQAADEALADILQRLCADQSRS